MACLRAMPMVLNIISMLPCSSVSQQSLHACMIEPWCQTVLLMMMMMMMNVVMMMTMMMMNHGRSCARR